MVQDNKRQREINRIKNEIRQIKTYISHDNSAIERFKKMNNDQKEWALSQIMNKQSKNADRESEITYLKKRITEVENGSLDATLEQNEQKETHEIQRRHEEVKLKKREDLTHDRNAIINSRKVDYSLRQLERTHNYNMREIEKNWQFFIKTIETFPEYMSKKLKKMPNNKGYKWKNVFFYGELPAVIGEPITIFETQKDGLLVIYETTDTDYNIWYKKNNSKKYLHSSTPRRMIRHPLSSLESYIKIL